MNEIILTSVYYWWIRLDPPTANDNWNRSYPKSYRSEIKRCRNLSDIVLTEGFQVLWKSIHENDVTKVETERLAMIAGIIAKISRSSEIKEVPVGKCLALKAAEGEVETEKPIISPIRFRQILSVKTDQELYSRFSRILGMVNGMNTKSLISDLWWLSAEISDETSRPSFSIRTKWAMDYYKYVKLNEKEG